MARSGDTSHSNQVTRPSQTVRPVASDLPNANPWRNGVSERLKAPRSKMVFGVSGTSGTGSLPWTSYAWKEPFTWQDGATYGEGDLRQQLITNVKQIPHLLAPPLAADYEHPDNNLNNAVVGWETSLPIAANEIWAIWLVYILDISAGVWAPGLRVPDGALVYAQTVSGSGTDVENFSLYGSETSDTYSNASSLFPAHGAGYIEVNTTECIVVCGAAGGFMVPLIQGNDANQFVKAGSIVFGMRLKPV